MIKVISDSTCDLSKELLDRYSIDVLPLHVILGDNDYDDDFNLSTELLYQWSDENKAVPKTAACTLDQVKRTFAPYLADGDEIICFSISSQMSSSNNVMHLAAQQLGAEDQVTVIDSENLSAGVGLLVIKAVELARQGMPRFEIAEHIELLKPRVRASFVVDTLTYLHRGGRCGGLSALLGSSLKLHPQINVIGGKMVPGRKYRGKMSHVIHSYVDGQHAAFLSACRDHVFITHSGCDPDIISAVHDHLRSLNHFAEIHITRTGGVISSHCGPGTLGIGYISAK